MLHLEVTVSLAYRKSHRPCYSDPELIPLMAQGYKVAEKPNRVPNATWNMNVANIDIDILYIYDVANCQA